MVYFSVLVFCGSKLKSTETIEEAGIAADDCIYCFLSKGEI